MCLFKLILLYAKRIGIKINTDVQMSESLCRMIVGLLQTFNVDSIHLY